MSRIKCPNCGSTAQIMLTWEDRDSYSSHHEREYDCGCGCHFGVIFEAVESCIYEEEEADETAPCVSIGAGGEVWTGSMPSWD